MNVVHKASLSGAKLDLRGVSPSSAEQDFALDGALCMRAPVVGEDLVTGMPLTDQMQESSERLRAGIDELLLTSDWFDQGVLQIPQ